MHSPLTPDELLAAREAGIGEARRALDGSPGEPLLRLAWAKGFNSVDHLREAVTEAKTAGFTWRQIGEALGENPRTAETKYGSGRDRMKRYRQRRKAAT